MRITINGKRYNSERCETLAKYHYYNNGNYSGTNYLLLAKDGTFLTMIKSNGQDLYMEDSMLECEDPVGWLEGVDLTEEEEKRLVELNLITIV